MSLTRRELLTGVVRAGGYTAGFNLMQAMGLMAEHIYPSEPFSVPAGVGKGVSVVVLGAGIAGLAAAYELVKAGYSCTVLEPRDRPGGRSWSLRKGSKVEFTDGTVQTCDWDEGQYLNAGPGRIPSTHKTMFSYCRELGVPLEVEINTTRSGLLQNDAAFNGKPVEMRQVVNDTRGHVSELLAKAISQNALDQSLSKADKERMLVFLQQYGPLSPDLFYKGSNRSGFTRLEGPGEQSAIMRDPLTMDKLLDADFWSAALFEEALDMQATMFQPVGGMDQLPFAFAKSLGNVITYHRAVTQIRKLPKGVRVSYRDTKTGATGSIDADYCVCTIPFTVLRSIDTDFSAPYKQIISDCAYISYYKVAWQSKRFWERDFNIYGGMSYLKQDFNLIWYPSGGLHTEKGILITGYSEIDSPEPNAMRYPGADLWMDRADFDRLPMKEKFNVTLRGVEKLHPGYSKELHKPMFVSWDKIPYSLGSLIGGHGSIGTEGFHKIISQPDDRTYFAGEHATYSVWQEGAAMSAQYVVSQIADRTRLAKA